MNITKLSEVSSQHVSHDPQLFKKVMIENGAIPHLTNFSQVVIKPGQHVSKHSHEDMYEVFFVQQGECEVTVEYEIFNIQQDSSFVIELKKEHSFMNAGDKELVLLYFGIVE